MAVVLVEPQGPLNIGSVCRAMANFGFSDLRLVNPQTNHLGYDARLMAVKASVLLESAKVYSRLDDALTDCQYAFGTTRRFGRYRDRDDFLYPDAAAETLVGFGPHVQTALVFGREDCGLFTEELDLCQRFITIPTCDELPSMNLAQAVSLCLYELGKIRAVEREGEGGGAPAVDLADNGDVEKMYSHMEKALVGIGYLDKENPDHILRVYRRMFGRSGLSARDVRVLRGLWRKVDWVRNELGKSEQKNKEQGDD
ncbi:MAG: RNA methyltransferase [Desulfuromonas sp.]|nr:RNA methyltransferase [Desulfuromonas sp.]